MKKSQILDLKPRWICADAWPHQQLRQLVIIHQAFGRHCYFDLNGADLCKEISQNVEVANLEHRRYFVYWQNHKDE